MIFKESKGYMFKFEGNNYVAITSVDNEKEYFLISLNGLKEAKKHDSIIYIDSNRISSKYKPDGFLEFVEMKKDKVLFKKIIQNKK